MSEIANIALFYASDAEPYVRKYKLQHTLQVRKGEIVFFDNPYNVYGSKEHMLIFMSPLLMSMPDIESRLSEIRELSDNKLCRVYVVQTIPVADWRKQMPELKRISDVVPALHGRPNWLQQWKGDLEEILALIAGFINQEIIEFREEQEKNRWKG